MSTQFGQKSVDAVAAADDGLHCVAVSGIYTEFVQRII